MYCRSLSVLFLFILAIVLFFFLRFTASDYLFGIFKLYLWKPVFGGGSFMEWGGTEITIYRRNRKCCKILKIVLSFFPRHWFNHTFQHYSARCHTGHTWTKFLDHHFRMLRWTSIQVCLQFYCHLSIFGMNAEDVPVIIQTHHKP